MVQGSLKGMASGGLYDHLGGGFFRCSTDVRWQIPQFEKTVYDNALLALAYGEAAQSFHEEPFYKEVMVEVLKFVTEKLQAPEGGFYSGLSALTDGAEGSFYTWQYDDLRRKLTEEQLDVFTEAFGVTEWGNFEGGANHLKLDNGEEGWSLKEDSTVKAAMQVLKGIRDRRVQPAADDKLVACWNGLAIHALAIGHRVCGGDETGKAFLAAAQKAAGQLRGMLSDGKLCRMIRGKTRSTNEGMLEDYALCIQGLLALYQEDFDVQWYELSLKLQEIQDELFSGLGKRYSLSPLHNSPLPPRQDFLDSEIPSAQSTAITNLLTLNALSLDLSNPKPAEKYLQKAEKLLLAVGDAVVKAPLSHASYLIALDQYMDSQTVVIVTPGAVDKTSAAAAMLAATGSHYFPQAVFVTVDAGQVATGPPVVRDKELYQGSAAVYILGSEGNVEFNHMVSGHDQDAINALHNPSEIRFQK